MGCAEDHPRQRGGPLVSETSNDDDGADIPEEPPGPPAGGEAAIPDRPLGVPADAPEDDDELPGIPEQEPPASG